MAEIILILNAVAYLIVEGYVLIKTYKMPVPADYPPKGWDWFQRWVETKWFWVELLLFLVAGSVIGYVLCM